MANSPDPDSPGQPGVTGMLGWLGYFLLVFVVAGFAFYVAGDAGNGISDRPTLSTRK